MKILVTGAAGFIGSHLSDRFIADGHSVVGLDNLTTGREANVNAEVDFYPQDVANIQAVIDATVTPDLIVHCAASYSDRNKWHRDTQTNVVGTINTVIAARECGATIVYTQTALPPVNSYAITKTAGMQFIQQSDVQHLIFRLANIYGPRNLSGPIPTFYKRLTAGEPCTVVDTTRDMVYIDDLVDLIPWAINDDLVGVYDVCSGQDTTILELFNLVDMALDGEHGAEVISPPEDEAMTDVSVHQRVPGWAPRVALGEGIAEAVRWYHANPPEQTFTHLSIGAKA